MVSFESLVAYPLIVSFQDILFLDWILYLFSRLFCSHRQVWYSPRRNPAQQDTPGHVRPRMRSVRFYGGSTQYLLLEGYQIFHWCLGRLRFGLVVAMLQGRWCHHPCRHTLDSVHL